METEKLQHDLSRVIRRIEFACKRIGRDPQNVRLLLATKTVPPERIKLALESGQTLIGENKIQEVKEKFDALKTIPHESHFIGHLQTNKVKDILAYDIKCLQSLDRLELAEKLQQRLTLENKDLDVFIQVNTSKEESKFGIDPQHSINLVRQVAEMDRLHIKGLMTIGLFSKDLDAVRLCFQKLKNLQLTIASLNLPGVSMKELSMGMSGDLGIAVEEGATIVRIGTAVFGKRLYPDSYYWPEKA